MKTKFNKIRILILISLLGIGGIALASLLTTKRHPKNTGVISYTPTSNEHKSDAETTDAKTNTSRQNKSRTLTAKTPQADITATGLDAARSVPLYGFNGENNRGVCLTDPALLRQIKSLDMQILRYPGGGNADWWDWRTGWMVKSPNLPQNYKAITSPPYYNLDSLKKITVNTHCQVVFVLNMVSSTLQDQIAMLKYASNLGIPVKWVELGNEDNGLKSAGMSKFEGAEHYGSACQDWIKAIHQNFPAAEVSIVGGDTDSPLYPALNNWNLRVLNRASEANAVVLHSYPVPDRVVDESGIDFRNLYNNTIDIYNNGGFKKVDRNKEIWVTEYNIQWAYVVKKAAIKKEIQNYATSWGQGLGILLMTSTITNFSPHVTMLLNHGLSGFSIFAAIETFPKPTFNLLPNGIGMQAWLNTAKGMNKMQKIQFSGDAGTVPDYLLFGWEFTNGTQHKLILVNLEGNSTSVNLQSVLASSSMSYQTLYADKNKQVWKDVNGNLNGLNEVKGSIKSGIISVPAYSIVTIE